MAKQAITLALTGVNAVPDSPGPGLAVARCIRAVRGEHIRIIALGYDAFDPGLYLSKYFDAAYLIPYPFAGSESLLARLAQIQQNEGIDVLIPCLDAELPVILSLQQELEAMGIRTFLPNAQQLAERAKDRLPKLAKLAGIKTPEIRLLSDPAFFHSCSRENWRYPIVIKGVFYDAHVVYTPQEAETAFNKIAAQWGLPVIAQKMAIGEEHNLSAIGDGEGNMLAEVMMKKRAVSLKGKAWVGVSTVDERLSAAASRLVQALKWRGPLEIEVMRDADGAYHLIEINPRFPAWIYLSVGVGRNLPALLLQLALEEKPSIDQLEAPKAGTMFIRYTQEHIVSLDEFEQLTIYGEITR